MRAGSQKELFLKDEAKKEFPVRGASQCTCEWGGGEGGVVLCNSDIFFIYPVNHPRQMLNFCERYFLVKGCRGGHYPEKTALFDSEGIQS